MAGSTPNQLWFLLMKCFPEVSLRVWGSLGFSHNPVCPLMAEWYPRSLVEVPCSDCLRYPSQLSVGALPQCCWPREGGMGG